MEYATGTSAQAWINQFNSDGFERDRILNADAIFPNQFFPNLSLFITYV